MLSFSITQRKNRFQVVEISSIIGENVGHFICYNYPMDILHSLSTEDIERLRGIKRGQKDAGEGKDC